jgi:hypothetical protein
MWRFCRRPRPDAVIDTLIVPPVPRHVGHDETKAVQAASRRAVADRVAQQARRIRSQDRGSLRRVG